MWVCQMESAILHEKNFRESVRLLVIQDKLWGEKHAIAGYQEEENGKITLQARNLRDSDSEEEVGLSDYEVTTGAE